MKKRNYTLTTALTAALCCLICLLNGCTRDNDIDIPQTSVNTMGATTVQPGETITLTGDNMHLISKVYFGDVTTLDIKTPQADHPLRQIKYARKKRIYLPGIFCIKLPQLLQLHFLCHRLGFVMQAVERRNDIAVFRLAVLIRQLIESVACDSHNV